MEQCDGLEHNGLMCLGFGAEAGALVCNDDCQRTFEACYQQGWALQDAGTMETLYGVWGTSPANVFAVGSFGTIMHYSGARWLSMPSGTTNDLRGVWGSASNDVFAVGSTASITTIEFEPALVRDMTEALEKLWSRSMHSHHSQTWGDDNGFSHLRASFMGPDITVPVHRGELVLGTWQQIVVLDHDNEPRQRKVFVQVVGEGGPAQPD